MVQCSSVYYEIFATQCGTCPPYTLRNTVTCGGVHIDMKGLSVCTISVKVISCAGNPISEYIKSVILKGFVLNIIMAHNCTMSY